MPESATGVRRVDKIFQAAHKDTGDPRFFHVEARKASPNPSGTSWIRRNGIVSSPEGERNPARTVPRCVCVCAQRKAIH
jgi:hypothetical protein